MMAAGLLRSNASNRVMSDVQLAPNDVRSFLITSMPNLLIGGNVFARWMPGIALRCLIASKRL
jgi:hypothetical protein